MVEHVLDQEYVTALHSGKDLHVNKVQPLSLVHTYMYKQLFINYSQLCVVRAASMEEHVYHLVTVNVHLGGVELVAKKVHYSCGSEAFQTLTLAKLSCSHLLTLLYKWWNVHPTWSMLLSRRMVWNYM